MMSSGNIFDGVIANTAAEQFQQIILTPGVRIERIISCGQSTPDGEWYDQDWPEWVLVLQGSARIRFETEPAARELKTGDWLEIKPHARHRVEYTDAGLPTIWLAVHMHQAAHKAAENT